MTSVAQTRSRAQKTICLSALFLAWAVGYADRIVMSTAIIPIGKEFALDAQQAGMVLSTFYVSYAIMQLLGGLMSDRYGSRVVVVVCVVAWSIFTALTSVAWSFTSLLVIRFLFGVGEGCFSPASSVTVAEVFPKQERARAKAFLISTVFLGNAVGSGLVALTVVYLGWRGAFHILAVVGLLVSAVLWYALRSGIAQQRVRTEPRESNQLGALIRDPAALKLTAIWFCSSILYIGMISWMPSYLMKHYQVDLLHIGLASAIPYLIAFLGTNGVGWLLDKVGQDREKHFLMGGSLGCAAFLSLMITTTSITLLVVYWTLCLLSFNFIYATVFSVPLKRFRSNLIGSATGLMNFGGQIAGAVAPVVMGSLIVAFGGSYLSAFWFLVGAALAAFLLSLTWQNPVPPLQQQGPAHA
ncbi:MULTISPECIES: MFS transporter [unclassified Pseudomonas]|uniref:MFS transporter n=1 Tax=unclassified Pseudomonas TaxID=196821 RepID=UPI002AC8D403|nr:MULTISPECIES: MFS transporter [unclassified Pseudomonas]WPX64518.1 MFS transporter [Pseudomonas sp. MH10]